jgi:hypothetical protein
LTLDATTGTTILWELETESGIPVKLSYTCNDDPELKGTLTLPLSLARRIGSPLTVSQGSVTNNGRLAVTSEYYLVGDRAIGLSGEQVIEAGQTLKLPPTNGIDYTKDVVTIPAEGIVYISRDLFSLSDFDISQSAGWKQTVTVENRLPAFDENLKLPLDSVEATVFYSAGGAPEVPSGPWELSPLNARGSSVTVPFIKPMAGSFTFRVEGTAYYDKKRTMLPFKSEPTSSLTIVIDASLVQQH